MKKTRRREREDKSDAISNRAACYGECENLLFALAVGQHVAVQVRLAVEHLVADFAFYWLVAGALDINKQ